MLGVLLMIAGLGVDPSAGVVLGYSAEGTRESEQVAMIRTVAATDAERASEGGLPAPAALRGPGASGSAAAATVAPRRINLPSGGSAAYIRIEGMIDEFTPISLRRRVDRAMRVVPTPSVIVIEIDTPGGRVDAAMEIARFIRQDIHVPTVAWVTGQALSAGSLIATSTDHLVMSPSSTIGDSAVIQINMLAPQAPTVDAKMVSPWLAEYRDNAERRGYPFALLHAMVVLGVEVFLIERDTPAGIERLLVNEADYLVMVEGLSVLEAERRIEQRFAESDLQGVGRPTAQVSRDGGQDDRGQWTLVRRVHDGSTLLTLTQDEAVDFGLAASRDIRTEADLQSLINAEPDAWIRVNQTWSESVARFLSGFWVRAILLGLFIIFAFIELQTPGLGVAGLFAMTALAGVVGAPLILGLAEVWHILLFFLGLALIAIELLVLPGIAVAGLAGVFFVVVGLVLMSVPNTGGPMTDSGSPLIASLISVLTGLGIGMMGLLLAARFYNEIPFLRHMVLTSPTGTTADGSLSESGAAADGAGQEAAALGGAFSGIRVGDEGVVTVTLRPVGRVRIGNRTVDVVCDGGWIDTGTRVRVVEVSGNHVVVGKA